MNMVVSLLICLGYIVDYSVDLVAAMLLIYDAVDPELNLFLISIKQVFLVVCIFVAYMVLLKIFMTYQRQMNEAFEKQALREEKAREKAALREVQKREQQAIDGESGTTPTLHGAEELLITEEKPTFKQAVNDDDDDHDPESFVTLALRGKVKTLNDRINSVRTVNDGNSHSESSEDSFGTDSEGDSILDCSFDDLNATDKALQNQILTNFVYSYKKGFDKGVFMRQETKFAMFSPSNSGQQASG